MGNDHFHFQKQVEVGKKRIEVFKQNEESIITIADCLMENKIVTELKVNCIDGNIGCKYLSRALEKNKTLIKLDLSGNKINDEGCKFLRDSLKKNSTLKSLNLAQNLLSIKSGKYICDILMNNSSLEIINLNGNFLGDKGIELISNSLKYNTSLKQLDIVYNGIKLEGSKKFSENLANNFSLLECRTNEVMSANHLYFSKKGYTDNSFTFLDVEKQLYYNSVFQKRLKKILLVFLLMRKRAGCIFFNFPKPLLNHILSFVRKPEENDTLLNMFKSKKKKEDLIAYSVFIVLGGIAVYNLLYK
eukprot:TRINITY_DN5861_c0_g1_i1.p1 TRINITY_DN5861_c0_g1~~TRINITY_DN5861_c0_g1_i1.p1  ORF type:complete len:302 (-),score=38.73 TRINITY_DN5861_c0_g1_i1:3-908(-)